MKTDTEEKVTQEVPEESKEFNFHPIAGSQNRVVILPDNPETKTASGLIIPENAQKPALKGTVIAISRQDHNGVHPVLEVGCRISYGQYSGTEIEVQDKKYIIARESDVYGFFS